MLTLHVIGDSISQHYGPYLQQYLAGAFAYSRKEGMPGEPAEPNSANGGDSALVLRYLRACQERSLHWDCLLLNRGLHDLRTSPATGAKQVPLVAYGANLETIVGVAAALAERVVWVRTTPVVDVIHNTRETSFQRFAADVVAYNSVADAVMAAYGIPVIDLFTFTQRLGDDVFLDHVHFVDNVRHLQAAFIAGSLLASMLGTAA